ncbi:UNVERIFIED_CONTAM: hypothetical protein GTU68_065800 [Idotea baltica]|nr:hypothetical protein [Idotea baltica]
MTFKELGIIEPILRALSGEGYTHPTPIQAQSIPILLGGDDLLGCAQTGTGKTAAFAIPILQHLAKTNERRKNYRPVRALIVTPTRELAIQIGDSFTAYGKYTGLRNTVIFGGVKQGAQTQALRRGVDILVATPGRLLDLMGQGYISLSAIHGNKSQGARQRALNSFKDGQTRVLVATDIAARGIDVSELPYVINYDLPNVAETYVHRIGRTGRAKASGIALSFCDLEERAYLKDIQKLIDQKIPVIEEHPYVDESTAVSDKATRPKGGGQRPSNHRSGRNKRWQGRRRSEAKR